MCVEMSPPLFPTGRTPADERAALVEYLSQLEQRPPVARGDVPFTPEHRLPGHVHQARPEHRPGALERFADGFVRGDYSEDRGFAANAGRIVASVVPFYGQGAALRDVTAGIRDVVRGTPGGAGNLAIAALGAVPLVGRGAAVALRSGRAGVHTLEAGTTAATSGLVRSEHAVLRGRQGRPVGEAAGDIQRARQGDVFVQPDGRFVIRGRSGREHIVEGNELVTSIAGRSSHAHQQRLMRGDVRHATTAEFERLRALVQ